MMHGADARFAISDYWSATAFPSLSVLAGHYLPRD
jgi:hypothetical protein